MIEEIGAAILVLTLAMAYFAIAFYLFCRKMEK